ncbi:MAG: aspartate-semialdehyde dehydrogenase, partial [Bacteroidota bacterium]
LLRLVKGVAGNNPCPVNFSLTLAVEQRSSLSRLRETSPPRGLAGGSQLLECEGECIQAHRNRRQWAVDGSLSQLLPNTMKNKLRVGILGATGMVGQRFITLLEDHPWFAITCVGASPKSAGKTYAQAVEGRWTMHRLVPDSIRNVRVKTVEDDLETIARDVDLVFSALDMDKEKIKELEIRYAEAGVAVVSNNSAHRWTEDVPIIMPEINAHHASLIDSQRKFRGWNKGLLVVKPNCSLQSYLPVIYALMKFDPIYVSVTTLQAISGAGKTFDTWPEMMDNVIPFIKGEEEKTEKEPMKILGSIKDGKLELNHQPVISATCVRVPVTDGHMASVAVKFKKKPSRAEFLGALEKFGSQLDSLNLPSAPRRVITYLEQDDRPQTRLDRDVERGMGIVCGRLREDALSDWKFITLVHNTVRGAAGGAILVAELLVKKDSVVQNS